MFKPSTMSRIRLIIHKKYFDKVLSALQDIGVMQIEALPEKTQSLLHSTQEVDYKEIADNAQRFRGLEASLVPINSDKKFSFDSIEQLLSQANSVKIDERVSQIRKELDEISANLSDISSKLVLLERISDFGQDLSILNTRNIVSFAVYGQQLKILEEQLAKNSQILEIKLEKASIFSMKKSGEKDFSTIAEKHRVTIEFIPPIRGKINENRKEFEESMEFLLEKKKSLEGELHAISEEYYQKVSALREQLDIEMEKFEVISKLGVTAAIVAIEGWVPEESMKKLERLLREITEKKYILEYIKTKEHGPTKLNNPVSAKLYEFFVKFYSIPKSDEIDPTIMFAIAFPLFFGFMVGDVGYGAFMLVLAIWIIHRVNHPPKISRLPKAITSFISLLITRNSLKILAKSIIPGAVLAIILGIIFNEWFGFHLPYTALFNVETGLPTLLLLSGWVGVFMVSFGFFLGFLNKWAQGEKKHAIAKLGWLITGLGVVIFGLNVIHKASLGTDNISSLASYIMMGVGIIAIFKFEGPNGLMELPSLISHILSYTRLVGILLASVILAEVIDLIFVGSWHHSILLGIVGTIILVVGQLFNIVIAMFEPGIQGARLIYVEFFSKFFEGNGKAFKPFTTQRNRTLTRFKL
ncbi:MAG: V-type ATP synthase subunit I [Candidatus Micrarchaeales archaeon]